MIKYCLCVVLLFFINENLSIPQFEVENAWSSWKNDHKKNYTSKVEERLRFSIWKKNRDFITDHNEKYAKGLSTYEMGLNHLADMSSEEYQNMVVMKSISTNATLFKLDAPKVDGNDVPSSIDWTKKGYVTPVKNQNHCGSCWAFSVTGAIEGAVKKSTGKLISFSEQQLVDCSKEYDNQGCKGGLTDKALQYLIDNKGIESEISYPYEAVDKKCRYRKQLSQARVKSYKQVTEGDEEELRKAVANVGPISVTIDAEHDGFRFYKKGVYYEPKCMKIVVHHAVLVVGYGKASNGAEYWKVKNSWSATYGDKGYILMARNRNNNCGIATKAIYPVL